MNDSTIPTSEVLYLAADDIERDGWATGNEGMLVEGPHCVMGAIGSAIGAKASWSLGDRAGFDYGDVEDSPAARALLTFLGDRVVLDCHGEPQLWAWNDDQDGPEQVVATLRAAALIEAAKERPANLVVFDAPTLAEAVGVR